MIVVRRPNGVLLRLGNFRGLGVVSSEGVSESVSAVSELDFEVFIFLKMSTLEVDLMLWQI